MLFVLWLGVFEVIGNLVLRVIDWRLTSKKMKLEKMKAENMEREAVQSKKALRFRLSPGLIGFLTVVVFFLVIFLSYRYYQHHYTKATATKTETEDIRQALDTTPSWHLFQGFRPEPC